MGNAAAKERLANFTRELEITKQLEDSTRKKSKEILEMWSEQLSQKKFCNASNGGSGQKQVYQCKGDLFHAVFPIESRQTTCDDGAPFHIMER